MPALALSFFLLLSFLPLPLSEITASPHPNQPTAIDPRDKAKQHLVMEKFRQDVLKAHNELRAKHSAPPLELDGPLSKNAQAYAENLIKTGKLQHSNCQFEGDNIGENLAFKMSSDNQDFGGEEATRQWYDEIKDHNFQSKEFNPSTGHFTQVVWKSTKKLGVGKAKDGKGKVIVVCQYKPPGNILNYLLDNCLPPK